MGFMDFDVYFFKSSFRLDTCLIIQDAVFIHNMFIFYIVKGNSDGSQESSVDKVIQVLWGGYRKLHGFFYYFADVLPLFLGCSKIDI